MYARSSTLLAKKSSLNRGIAFLGDELMPEMLTIDGCVGLSLLVDRETGRCVATSSWQDEEAMHASEGRVPPLRKRLMSAFGASGLTNDEWEVVVMHREHRAADGAYARVTYLRADPARADESIETFKALLPVIDVAPGFCSASLLLNRESGRAASNVVFDTSAALDQTGTQAKRAEIIEVADFELAVAHLRVPELV
jgi:quinol monooxygenase YgiN